ncbi:MAG: methylenetetrahydrofolate reductase C-terminal domain-containing protein [bacterium]
MRRPVFLLNNNMIAASRKPFSEIFNKVKSHKNILVLGCGTCMTVCFAGGEKEVGILASQLRLAAKQNNLNLNIIEHVVMRQCDREFFDEELREKAAKIECVISMGCGVGVQFFTECFPDKAVYPALNTKAFCANMEQGVWAEYCAGCGDCLVDKFGGICPIARCSKSLLNGPCGGSSKGKCEVDPQNTDCAWQLIYDRMEKLGRLKELEENQPLKDWSNNRDGGPRKVIREDMKLE